MASLGKCLVFYFKYGAEMDRLYWQPRETAKEPSVDGVPDKERVLSMIERVGNAACREAGAFLEACAERIEPHLHTVAAARRIRRNLEQTWALEWRLSHKKQWRRRFNV